MGEVRGDALGMPHMMQAFAEPLRARRGHVHQYIVGAQHAQRSGAGRHCSSKAAALSLAEGARQTLKPDGIPVINVFPKMIDTPMSAVMAGSKLPPGALAQAILQAVSEGAIDIYP